jgi:predicted Fe-Mo cluster-binding NifX family protein
MKITFAFALNNDDVFENKHFGETDKFVIFTYEKSNLIFKEEAPNKFNISDEKYEHGSEKKANAIISFLKDKGVNVLVSKQFGKNLKKVNQHFVPVIISEEQPEQVAQILVKNINWFKDELKNRKSDFMLFQVKTGILKMAVD